MHVFPPSIDADEEPIILWTKYKSVVSGEMVCGMIYSHLYRCVIALPLACDCDCDDDDTGGLETEPPPSHGAG